MISVILPAIDDQGEQASWTLDHARLPWYIRPSRGARQGFSSCIRNTKF